MDMDPPMQSKAARGFKRVNLTQCLFFQNGKLRKNNENLNTFTLHFTSYSPNRKGL